MYLLWLFSLLFMINGICILFNQSFPLPRYWWYSSCYLVEVSLFKFSHLVLKSTWNWFLCIAWDGNQVSPFCIWIYIWFFTIYWKTTLCPVLWKVILVKKQVSIYEWVCFWTLSLVCQCICLSLTRYLLFNLLEFLINSKPSSENPSTLLFSKMSLTVVNHLHFHKSFWTTLWKFTKCYWNVNPDWIYMWL